MLRKIFIDSELPRNISHFNGSFGEGLLFTRIFGFIFCLLGLLFFLICFYKYKNYILAGLCLALCIYGIYLIRYTQRIPELRKKIFLNGSMVTARVVKHGKRINPLKLTTEYYLILKVNGNDEEVKVVHTMKGFHASAPIDSKTEGIFLDGKYFFGESIGGKFDTKKY